MTIGTGSSRPVAPEAGPIPKQVARPKGSGVLGSGLQGEDVSVVLELGWNLTHLGTADWFGASGQSFL